MVSRNDHLDFRKLSQFSDILQTRLLKEEIIHRGSEKVHILSAQTFCITFHMQYSFPIIIFINCFFLSYLIFHLNYLINCSWYAIVSKPVFIPCFFSITCIGL